MFPEDVLLVIHGHQRRAEQWDRMLVNLAVNIVAPPKRGKKSLDVDKMHLFKQKKQESPADRLEDPEDAAAWLAAMKKRG